MTALVSLPSAANIANVYKTRTAAERHLARNAEFLAQNSDVRMQIHLIDEGWAILWVTQCVDCGEWTGLCYCPTCVAS